MQTSRQIVLVLLLSVVVSIIRIWFSQHPQFFPILEDTSLLDQPAPPSVFYSNFTLKTKLAIDNVADHPDLYIWFKDPNEMAKMSNIRVTRCQHIEEPYDKLHERLLVEPLLCSDDKKPSILAPIRTFFSPRELIKKDSTDEINTQNCSSGGF